VRGDLNEVVFLARVGHEVEELLDLVLRPVDVFPVLAYQGLGLGDEVFIPDAGVLVEKLAAPDRFLIGQVKWGDVLALHALRCWELDGGEDGGSEVDTKGEVVVGAAVLFLRHAWVADDEWHTDAFLVRIPLVSQAVLGVVVAVVGGEDDEGVVQDPLFFELIEYLAAGAVHLGGKATGMVTS